MKFKYFKFPLRERSDLFGTSILRPVIPVEVTAGNTAVGYAALIDSGADYCIFDAGLGELLGIEVRSGKLIQFGGVQANMPSKSYLHEITISVGDSEHKIAKAFLMILRRMVMVCLVKKDFSIFLSSLSIY